MTGIILIGGKGTRLGNENKTFIKLGRTTILERIISRLKEADFEEIIISGRKEILNDKFMSRLTIQNLTLIEDIILHQGPLVGLYSGLIASESFYNFVVGGDMPFLSTNLIKYMKDKVGDADIVVPKTKDGIEPLHAIYSKNCIKVIKQKIEDRGKRKEDQKPKTKDQRLKIDEENRGQRKEDRQEKEKLSLQSIFSQLKIKYILEKEILQFSLPEITFFNINNRQDLENAKRLVRDEL